MSRVKKVSVEVSLGKNADDSTSNQLNSVVDAAGQSVALPLFLVNRLEKG